MYGRTDHVLRWMLLTGLTACQWPIEEVEPNDTAAEADELSINSGGRTGTLSIADQDFFRIDVPADYGFQKLTVSVTDANGDCFSGVDPYLEIRASDGETRLLWAEDSPDNFCPKLTFLPEVGYPYYAVVGTLWGGDTYYLVRAEEGGEGSISGHVSLDTASPDTASPDTASPDGTGTKGTGLEPLPTASQLEPGELLILSAPDLPEHVLLSRLHHRLGFPVQPVRPRRAGRYQQLRLTLPSADRHTQQALTLTLLTLARQVPGVLDVQPNGLFQKDVSTEDRSSHPSTQQEDADLLINPGDPLFSDQWALTASTGIQIQGAWELTLGDPYTRVAVIDDGHAPNHPDLRDKYWPGYDFISNSVNAADGDGPDGAPSHAATTDGHGSRVAGIIAAATHNAEGMAGVGWYTTYLPLRVCGAYGCVESDITEALWYVAGFETDAGPGQATRRADVANLSLSGWDVCRPALQDAITAATQRGVVVVVSAGNDNVDVQQSTPANCDGVIAVGATDYYGARTSFSNYGTGIHVMAPGQGILSPAYPEGGYSTADGTSFAAPHVAGVAALIKAITPELSPASIKDLLMQTAVRVDCAGVGDGCGAGLINATAAVSLAFSRPEDPPQSTVLVQAVDLSDQSRTFLTVARAGTFTLSGLRPGTYELRAWIDSDGDQTLDSAVETFADATSTYVITEKGEDIQNVVLGRED